MDRRNTSRCQFIQREFSGEVNSEIERKFFSVLKNNYPEVNYEIMGQAEEAADMEKD